MAIFFSDISKNDISDMISQIHHLYLEKYLIQEQYDPNFQHLCWHYCVSTSYDIFVVAGKYPTFYVS